MGNKNGGTEESPSMRNLDDSIHSSSRRQSSKHFTNESVNMNGSRKEASEDFAEYLKKTNDGAYTGMDPGENDEHRKVFELII